MGNCDSARTCGGVDAGEKHGGGSQGSRFTGKRRLSGALAEAKPLYKQLFASYDRDGDGEIDANEFSGFLGSVLRASGKSVNQTNRILNATYQGKRKSDAIFALLDVEKTKRITFNTFWKHAYTQTLVPRDLVRLDQAMEFLRLNATPVLRSASGNSNEPAPPTGLARMKSRSSSSQLVPPASSTTLGEPSASPGAGAGGGVRSNSVSGATLGVSSYNQRPRSSMQLDDTNNRSPRPGGSSGSAEPTWSRVGLTEAELQLLEHMDDDDINDDDDTGAGPVVGAAAAAASQLPGPGVGGGPGRR